MPLALNRNRLFQLLRVGVSLVFISLILRRIEFAEMGEALRSARLGYVGLAVCMPILGSVISVLRWHTLLKAQDQSVSVWYLVQSYLVGRFFNNILPSTIGGDAVRMMDVYRAGFTKSAAIATTIFDRGLGMLVLAFVGCVAALIPSEIASQIPSLSVVKPVAWLGVTGFVVAVAFLVRPPKQLVSLIEKVIPQRIAGILDVWERLRERPHLLGRAILLSFALQLNVIIYYFILSRGFDFGVSFPNFLLIVPLTLFFIMLPISVNGFGIRENAFAFFFALFGVPLATVFAFTLISYSGTITQGILGGIIYSLRK